MILIILTNERILRLEWAIYWPIRGRFSQWEADKTMKLISC